MGYNSGRSGDETKTLLNQVQYNALKMGPMATTEAPSTTPAIGEDVIVLGASNSDCSVKSIMSSTANKYGLIHFDGSGHAKIEPYVGIVGATKCKITYNAKGLVTGGEDLTASDIPDLSTTYAIVHGNQTLTGDKTFEDRIIANNGVETERNSVAGHYSASRLNSYFYELNYQQLTFSHTINGKTFHTIFNPGNIEYQPVQAVLPGQSVITYTLNFPKKSGTFVVADEDGDVHFEGESGITFSQDGVGDTDIWRDEEGNFIIASFNSIELCTDDSDGDILLTTATGKVLYNGEEVATQDWTTNQGYITDNEVPSVQTSSVVVTNATTNVNGRTFQHYTATLTTAGGFTYYQILKDGVNPTEAEAAEYMKYMTGSTFVPKYNYDFPKQVIFTFADRSTWKPQYSTSDGLRLYRLTTPLALESQIPDAVSGTNDGTNWTSLTIGSDTYGLASGGSSTGGYTVDFTFGKVKSE